MGDMSDDNSKNGGRVTSIFTKQVDTPHLKQLESAFEALRNKTSSGLPLNAQQEEERDRFIDQKNGLFQERQDRGFIKDQALSYLTEIHNQEIEKLQSMDCDEWERFVENRMIEPLHTNTTVANEVEEYIQKTRQNWENNPLDKDENRFESKRELEEHIFNVSNMTTGEWEETKQHEYILSNTLSGQNSSFTSNMDDETKSAIDKSIKASRPAHIQKHYDTVLNAFKDRDILMASLMINRMPTGRVIGKEGIEDVLQEAVDNGYVDEFTVERIKNGEIDFPPPPQEHDEPSGP